jgi:hypothetical protein
MLFERAAGKFVTGSFSAMFIAKVLQVALTGLIANGAIERVIDE